MNIVYNGGANINLTNIYPKDEVWATKTFTVTGNNTTGSEMAYLAKIVVEENTFLSGALEYKLISENTSTSGKVIPSKTNYIDIASGSNTYILGNGNFTGPTDGNKVHTYNLEIYFLDNGKNQNDNINKSFSCYISLESIKYVLATDDDFSIRTYDILHSEGPYEEWYTEKVEIWQYTGNDDYVIIPETINGELITSTKYMFGAAEDESENIQYAYPVKGVATLNSNITDMESMFLGSQSTSLDLSSFNTSNVTNMNWMFSESKVTSLDLNSFDTSKAIYMQGMLSDILATSLNLSSFNTSNVTDISYMFQNSLVTNLDISSIDTSSVIDMSWMFADSQATSLDLSSFNTSNVTDMSYMFSYMQATYLDLKPLDTSNVTRMEGMFWGSKATIIDFSTFDTSNVTDMNCMFTEALAPHLDLSTFDTSNVIDTDYMFEDSNASTGYARTQNDADKFNSSTDKPAGLIFIVK